MPSRFAFGGAWRAGMHGTTAIRAEARRSSSGVARYWDEEIETLDREHLEAYQFRLLRRHLEHAYEGSPYYRSAFGVAGVAPGDVKAFADLARFPFIDKAILRDRQLAAPLLGDVAAVPEREVVYVSASNGSTGVPTLSRSEERRVGKECR